MMRHIQTFLPICEASQRALFELGKVRGRNDLQSDEELLRLVIISVKPY